MIDLKPAAKGPRHSWGLQNMLGVGTSQHPSMNNEHRQHRVQEKINTFCNTAIFPQQLTIPRQYATTPNGVWVYRELEGRKVGEIREDGARVVVLENAQQARFVMSPLMSSKHDARMWAKREMGVQ